MSLSQAAERLNLAMQRLESRIARLQQEKSDRPEMEQLEQENQQLRALLESLEMRLELSLVQLENMMSREQQS